MLLGDWIDDHVGQDHVYQAVLIILAASVLGVIGVYLVVGPDEHVAAGELVVYPVPVLDPTGQYPDLQSAGYPGSERDESIHVRGRS